MALNVYARFFENQIKVKDNQLSKTLSMEHGNFSKNFNIETEPGQFDIIIRFQDNVAKVLVKQSTAQPPVLVYLVAR